MILLWEAVGREMVSSDLIAWESLTMYIYVCRQQTMRNHYHNYYIIFALNVSGNKHWEIKSRFSGFPDIYPPQWNLLHWVVEDFHLAAKEVKLAKEELCPVSLPFIYVYHFQCNSLVSIFIILKFYLSKQVK